MSLKYIHELILQLWEKQQNGHLTHEEIDKALHLAQLWLFARYLPLFGTSQESIEALTPFKKVLSYATDINGDYTIAPTEKAQKILSLTVSVLDGSTVRKRDVEQVMDDQWAKRMDSQLNAVNQLNPIVRIVGKDSINIAPALQHAGEVTFIAEPEAPEFKYTQAGRVITYTGATELKWKTAFLSSVVFKAMSYLGLQLDDDKKVQISDAFLKDIAV